MHPPVVAALLGLVAGFILSLIFMGRSNPPRTTMNLNDTEKYIANIRALLWLTNTLLGGILGVLLWQATR